MPMNFKTSEEVVAHLELEKHVEGGYFRETFRSSNIVKTARGSRNEQTSIYYCLPSDDFSVWHKLVGLEETFHYHYGDSALIYRIQDNKIVTEVLGAHPTGKPTIVMPADTWFAIRPSGIGMPVPYILMSCSVTPGFEYEDLVIGTESILSELNDSEHKMARSLLKQSSYA